MFAALEQASAGHLDDSFGQRLGVEPRHQLVSMFEDGTLIDRTFVCDLAMIERRSRGNQHGAPDAPRTGWKASGVLIQPLLQQAEQLQSSANSG